MSVFHDLTNLQATTQPLVLFGTDLKHLFILMKLCISTFGAVTVLIGACIAIYHYFMFRFFNAAKGINPIRMDLAKTIILGLEFFIASDVIETTIAPDFQSLGILGILVVIRTLLNFSLHKEIKDLSQIQGSGVTMNDLSK